MGDLRFSQKLDALREARDRLAVVRALSDVELAESLAALSPEDPYLANVIATELSNRIARKDIVLETLLDGVVLVDDRGLVLFHNPAALTVFGGEGAIRVGSPLPEGEVADLMDRALEARGAVDREGARLVRPDGTRRELAVTARAVVRESDVRGVVLVVQDITARRDAEEALRLARLEESERRFRRIFDASIEELFEKKPPPGGGAPPS